MARVYRRARFHNARGGRLFALIFLHLLTVQAALSQSIAGLDKENLNTEKIRVSEPALAQEIAQQRGELIADYGAFQFFKVEPALAMRLAGRRGFQNAQRHNFVELNAGSLNTATAELQALRNAVGAVSGKQLHLIQFAGPVKTEWRKGLEECGVRIVCYVPNNAYLVYGDQGALSRLQVLSAAPHVQWEGVYLPGYKIHPGARTVDSRGAAKKPATDIFSIQLLADDQANPATLQLIDSLKLEPIWGPRRVLDYVNVRAHIPPERLKEIAARPDVISIQPYFAPIKLDERQDQIIASNLSGNIPSGPGYLGWLMGKGFSQAQFDASSFTVDVTDSGIDNGTTAPGHFGLYELGDSTQASRVIYNRLIGTPNGAGSTVVGCDGHGTVNAHIIGGYNNQPAGFPHTDSSGFRYGLGVCPFVRVGSSVIFDPDLYTDPDPTELQSRAYHDGARISNNSWGAAAAGSYDMVAQQYDALVRDAQPTNAPFAAGGNQEMVIVFAVGNKGPDPQSVCSPGTAKNVLTVGASENVRSLSPGNGGNDALGTDGCATADSDADSANDMAFFSSRGPCVDGRQKPDLVAPGTHITGGVPEISPPPSPNTVGTALACYNAGGVCALSGDSFFPTNQQFYTTSSGTSHSTPAAAGACALLRQFFINNGWPVPSPAMTKAYLVNSARYLNGSGANDTLWSPNQGMGEVNLGCAFDGTSRILRDELHNDKFTATGQTRTFTAVVADPSKPLRVTIAWTDAPGSTTGSAWNNDLDLQVVAGGNTYYGNVFSGSTSVTGGAHDSQNNVESVFLPAGVAGSVVITITAANIVSDGVPNEDPATDQDFALVVYNALATARPVVVPNAATLTAESCLPTNGVADSGETVTMNFGLSNVGTANTTNLVATLTAANGVSTPSAPQSYGLLVSNGVVVAKPFTFTANAGCGSTISPTFQLQDGDLNLGSVSFSIPLGLPVNAFSEGFDGVAAPNLPSGWSTSASGSETPWVTSTSTSSAGPNSAFSPDVSTAGVNELVTPVFVVPSGGAQLSFQSSYDLEGSGTDTSGYDGGVLEIRIGNGAFMDILDAGGSFSAGGYNHTISSGYSNPLAGRQAWSGTSGGFIATVVNLPLAADGQVVQLRWRCGCDNNTGGGGWYIDSVQVSGRSCCGANLQPVAAFNVTPTIGGAPLGVSFADSSSGPITNRQWSFGNGVTTNTTMTNFSYVYGWSGTNTVTLTVYGPGGTNTLSRPSYVVVTNVASQLAADSATIAAETCVDGCVDPGETVTVNFGLRNVGLTSTANLVGSLQSSGGIIPLSGSQNYGAIGAGGTGSMPFSFIATGGCGATNIATLQLQDGVNNLGLVSFPFVLGLRIVLAENFDNVSPPALPAGWSSSATGGQTPWTTTSADSDTAPNSAFSPDPTSAGVNELDSPVMTLPSTPVQLIFQHSYDLDNYGGSPHDGGVLEIKIGGGSWTDILAAGGSFVTNGYTGTLASGYGNPLEGRQAWSGSSGGFIPTIVNFPAAALGQLVQLRWRCATDSSLNSFGWYVDTVNVGIMSCCITAPSITTPPQNQAAVIGGTAGFNVGASGSYPLTYQWRLYGTNLPGGTSSTWSKANVQPADAGPYTVIVANSAGSVTSAPPVTLTLVNAPVLLNPRVSNGNFYFTLSGNSGYNYVVEVTTNWSNWTGLATLTNITGQVPFTQTNTSVSPFRAYRARLVP